MISIRVIMAMISMDTTRDMGPTMMDMGSEVRRPLEIRMRHRLAEALP